MMKSSWDKKPKKNVFWSSKLGYLCFFDHSFIFLIIFLFVFFQQVSWQLFSSFFLQAILGRFHNLLIAAIPMVEFRRIFSDHDSQTSKTPLVQIFIHIHAYMYHFWMYFKCHNYYRVTTKFQRGFKDFKFLVRILIGVNWRKGIEMGDVENFQIAM